MTGDRVASVPPAGGTPTPAGAASPTGERVASVPPGDAARRLRAAGLRVTRGRLAVVEALARQGGHRTADELARALAAAGTALPRASLYHALAALVAGGVVMVADAGPGIARYEVAGTWHHHLVCRGCGTVVDIPCVRGDRPCLEPDLLGVVADEAQVIFRGLCASCAAGPGDG